MYRRIIQRSKSTTASLATPAFRRLVQGLKDHNKTVAVVESCCGGLIQASLMAVPGSSAVYYGGSVAYNSQKTKPILLNDSQLHEEILKKPLPQTSPAETYRKSKEHWTATTAKAYCRAMNVDYAIAEGGASGPTFRPDDLHTGFAVIAIAGRRERDGSIELLAQETIRSPHAHREKNMRLFADGAATLAADTLGIPIHDDNMGINVEENDGGGSTLDRATHLRTNPEQLATLEASPAAKFVLIQDSTECLFAINDDGGSGGERLALLKKSQLPPITTSKTSQHSSFLGLTPDGAPIFSIDVSKADIATWEGLPAGVAFGNTRTHAPLMPSQDYEIVLYATALSHWKRTHQYCSSCGEPLEPVQGGTCLECTGCQSLSWPRQDPSIIVLVTDASGERALLARSPRHPPKMHTALAGFVEAGETMEQAVCREVWEETGVRVDASSIQYIASQPWPFPRSTMIGFVAKTAAEDLESLPSIQVDPEELVSADWFDREQVGEAAQIPGAVMNPDVAKAVLDQNQNLNLLIPPQGVLARTLIEAWLLQAR